MIKKSANLKGLNDFQKLKYAENLLQSIGIETETKRQGDVNMRIDAVGRLHKGDLGIFEFEFGNDALEIPRKLLEDFAILHRRYNKNKNQLFLFSVLKNLPNKRSDYYQVLNDIKKVVGIKIHTFTFEQLNDFRNKKGNFLSIDYKKNSIDL